MYQSEVLLVRFGREDADLIIESYRKLFNPNPVEYLCYVKHFGPIHIFSSTQGTLTPILISEPVTSDTPLNFFIEDYFPDDLKNILAYKGPFDLIYFFTNILLNHKCDIEDTCIKHLRLLMKLTIVLRPCTCLDWICRDLQHFDRLDLGSNLIAVYFVHFIVKLNLMSFFMKQWYMTTKDFLEKYIIRNDHIRPYIINIFEPYTHLCVARKLEYLFKLLIKYGAKNLDEHQNPAYETYTKDFFDPDYFRTEDEPADAPDLLINSRIKMRVLQVFIWNRFGDKRAIQMLPLSHLEPYITKQEYEDTFNGFVSYYLTEKRRKNFKRESWKWYKEIFEIIDDYPVTPRPLQDVCRYVIRDKMSRIGNLPHRVKDLFDDCVNPWEDYLTLENVLVKGSQFHLREFLEWVRRIELNRRNRRHQRILRYLRNRRNQRR